MSDLAGTTSGARASTKVEAANAASRDKNWSQAAQLWDELRIEQPQNSHYWLKTAEAYCEARLLREAERILVEAIARFPDHRWIAHCYTTAARYAGDWTKTLSRAETLRQTAPDFWPTWLASAEALKRLRQGQEAERLLNEAVARFPNEYWPNYAVARLKADRGDPQTAMGIWSTLAERFPSQRSATEALEMARSAVERSTSSSSRGFRPSRP